MLTIQPKIAANQVRNISFRSGEGSSVQSPEDRLYSQKTKEYEEQKKELEKLKEDKQTPNFLKKFLTLTLAATEALFQGWLVAWGAVKGARVAKSTVIKGANSKLAKEAKNVLSPMFKGIGGIFKKIGTKAADFGAKVKATKTYTKLADKFTKFVNKMDNNKYGKFVMEGFRTVGRGIKKAVNYIVAPFKKIKETDFSTAYDKVAKTTSTTLGVGAGAAAGYNEVMHPETAKVKEEKPVENKKDVDDIDAEIEEAMDEVEGEDE